MNDIHVLMFGGKRCGKTTVLASMIRETARALSGTQFSMSADPETAQRLRDAIDVIEGKMSAFNEPLTRVEVDENPTSAKQTSIFTLDSPSQRCSLHIHDIPGHGEAHEDHLPLGRVGDGLAFRGHGFDGETLQDGVEFAVSGHSLAVLVCRFISQR